VADTSQLTEKKQEIFSQRIIKKQSANFMFSIEKIFLQKSEKLFKMQVMENKGIFAQRTSQQTLSTACPQAVHL
jgi:hypothetical protein